MDEEIKERNAFSEVFFCSTRTGSHLVAGLSVMFPTVLADDGSAERSFTGVELCLLADGALQLPLLVQVAATLTVTWEIVCPGPENKV